MAPVSPKRGLAIASSNVQRIQKNIKTKRKIDVYKVISYFIEIHQKTN